MVVVVVVALITFFGLVWFGIAHDEVWRLVVLPLAIGAGIVILQLLVEALVNRMRRRRG